MDSGSLLPGKYTFEKYVGGNFLGEIVRWARGKESPDISCSVCRCTLACLVEESLLAVEDPAGLLHLPHSLPSALVTQVSTQLHTVHIRDRGYF